MTRREGACWESFSALVVGMVLLQQPDVGEGKVASLALALTLPLAVHVDLGHFYRVAHLQDDQKKREKDECMDTTHRHPVSLGRIGSCESNISIHGQCLTARRKDSVDI